MSSLKARICKGDCQLILASQSPRRRALLQQAGYQFRILPAPESLEADVERQLTQQQVPAPTAVSRLARLKADAVFTSLPATAPHAIVLAADTLAELDGALLGKPKDRNHARQMLRQLSDREHRVHTAICLRWNRGVHSKSGQTEGLATTRLRMDKLNKQQLDAYLETDLWRGKAGAFGYQDGWDWLHLIDGEPSNVVGLPLERLEQLLNDTAW